MVFVSLGGPAITVRDDSGYQWLFEDHPYCGPMFVNRDYQGINEYPAQELMERINKWYSEGKPIYRVRGVRIMSDKAEVGFKVGQAHSHLKYHRDENGHVYWAFKLLYEHQATLNSLIHELKIHDCAHPICCHLYIKGFATFNLQPNVLTRAIGAKTRSVGFYGVYQSLSEIQKARIIRRDNLVEALQMLLVEDADDVREVL